MIPVIPETSADFVERVRIALGSADDPYTKHEIRAALDMCMNAPPGQGLTVSSERTVLIIRTARRLIHDEMSRG